MKKTILLTIILTSVFLYGCNKPVPLTNQNNNQPSADTKTPITQGPSTTGELSCVDSDGGKNIYVKGVATTTEGNVTLHLTSDSCATVMDKTSSSGKKMYLEGLTSCSGDNCYVMEGYCHEYMGTMIDGGDFFQCPNGCNDYACIQ